MKGVMPDEGINPEELPDVLHDLWHTFLELNASRGNNGMGMSPITQLDLYAYSQLHQVRLSEFEQRTIRQLDSIALNSMNESKK